MLTASKRKSNWLSRGYQFGHRLSVPGDDDSFALLYQFEKTGKLSLCLVDVYLHQIILVYLVS